ncbi:G8 domain-containing protein DDB_G0286311-like [Sparus aurata]|uniref:G8 domain-containing protein DDB_G0286311-like n=2 Tax=Sparus aurata TaxID=8175 RepID=UPI0011C16071|nr:G8 domain-containing protein DDB_G0286311-like [Sparus aurata]
MSEVSIKPCISTPLSNCISFFPSQSQIEREARLPTQNFLRAVKDLKVPRTGSGTDSGEKTASTWPYYAEMHAILGGRPAIDPPVIVASFRPAEEDPTALLMAIVTPYAESPWEDLPESVPASSTNPPTTPSTTPTTAATPTPVSSTNPATPSTTLTATPTLSPRKRKRNANQQILDFLQAESANEQRRHAESEEKTERFLNLFERLVDKMPDK